MTSDISIFEHLRAHIRTDGPGLTEAGETLPDEQEVTGVAWAPGARDGVLTHHWAGQGEDDEVRRLSAAVTEAASRPRGRKAKAAYEALYETARAARIIPVVDGLLEAVRSSGIDPEGCYRVAYRLATEGRHREPVKLGIALLGLFDASHHRDELMTLGWHDEFTLFAAVALGNREDGDPEADWWELARGTDGWGRVHLVERLAGTRNPELRDWILREGFRNGVADAYLVGIAAETGGLADALSGDVDDELLDAAADILSTLAEEGGPVEGMPAYADGERATGLFLGHMRTRARELRHFLAVHDLHAYVQREWPDLAPRCREILDRPLWRDLAVHELGSPDDATFFAASRACSVLGVPTVRAYLDRLRDRGPLDARAWFHAVEDAGDGEIDEVIALAVELLPLAEIASGPSGEVGMGPGFEPHGCLDMILQGLGRWPGRGLPLILAGLASPGVRNRNMAVRALAAWDRDIWTPEVGDAVTTALAREPDGGVRGRLQALLDGRPLE